MNVENVFQSDLLTAGGGHFLKPTEIPEVTIGTRFGKAVVLNETVFVYGGECRNTASERIVQVYNVLTKKWSTLPPSPYSRSGATIIKDQLTLIGGRDITTNKLVTWTDEEWLELYPPMHTARWSPGVLAIGDLVIVSGGYGADGIPIDTIEFLDINNRKWIQSNLKLPQRLSLHHMSLCGEYIYIYYWNGYFWRMNKKNFMASLTNNEVHHWEELEDAPGSSSLLQYSTLPVLVGPRGIFIFEKKKWTQISKEMSYEFNCTASLNGTTFLTIGGELELGGEYQTRAVQYDIAVEVEGTSLKEQDKKDTSLEEQEKKDTSLKEYDKKDTSLKEQDKKDTSLKEQDKKDSSLKEQDKKDSSLKEQDKKNTSLKEQDKKDKKDTSLKEQDKKDKKDASLKEQDKKDANLKDELTNLKDEYSSFKEKELKEKQTLIDQVERLKRSEREYELKVQELMERNTQLKTEVADSSSKGTETKQKNIGRLEERIAELSRELRDTQKDNLQLRELITELKESKSELKDSNIELKESISELKKTNSDLNSQTTERIAELTRELRDTQKDNLHLKERNSDLKESNSQSTEKMAELTRELKDAQMNVNKLEVSQGHLEQRIDDLNKTNSLLDKGNSELETRLQQQQQSTEKVAKLQEENIKLREEKSFLEGSLKETEERRNALEEEKAKTEKQAEELRSNMLGKVEGFGSVLEDMKRSLDMLEERQSKDELMRTNLKLEADKHMNVVQKAIIDEVPQKWKEIATSLKFELNKIGKVEAKYTDQDKRCYEMLAEWLKHAKGSGELPRTLNTLYDALVDRDCRPEADKLVEEVKRMMK